MARGKAFRITEKPLTLHGQGVGVDTGGTFTDFVLLDATGKMKVLKLSSTGDDPAQSLLAGLKVLREQGFLQVGFALVHGTTVATNALLERRGASTALITTRGFRDVLAIGRQNRTQLYSLSPTPRPCLLPTERRLEVTERLDASGQVIVPLQREEAMGLLEWLKAEKVESVAVCLLFSYLNPAHEQAIGELARAKGFSVSLSSEIAPEVREYERTSTTVVNAYVAPIMQRYLSNLSNELEGFGCRSLRVMQSDGGALSAIEAGRLAVRTGLSGPAGGVIAATRFGMALGLKNLITLDMGGTSTDVALIENGVYETRNEGEIAGLPVRIPMLAIHTVGAGGGSIVRLDAAGALRVGPQSAGAMPGPVAYGVGEALTVTDAHVQLGRLPAQVRLGGSVPLYGERVHAAFTALSKSLGVSPEEAALGVIRIANTAMERALRRISVERGRDPSRFVLVSFGGAGGLHVCELANALGITRVLVPPCPGAFSALGLALAPIRREYVQSLPLGGSEISWGVVQQAVKTLRRRAGEDRRAEGIPPSGWQEEPFLEMRYRGQAHTLRVPRPLKGGLLAVTKAFHAAHNARYGYADVKEPVEIVAIRLVTVGVESSAELPSTWDFGEELSLETMVPLYEEGEWLKVPLCSRHTLLVKRKERRGPFLLVQPDSTLYVSSGWRCRDTDYGCLLLTKE